MISVLERPRQSDEGLKAKQARFIKAFRSGKYDYLCAAGSTGSGKTFVELGLIHLLCYSIPNLRFAVIRKSEKNLRQTSIPSYNRMKIESRSFGESVVHDMRASYKNGSEILFVWADVTKDPDLNNIKGLELTGAVIEETNQIDKRYFDLLKTRIGRWNNRRCPQFILLNLNPSLGWVKDLFYDNWAQGTLPSRHYFEEFSVYDNDSLSPEFIRGLKDLPEEEYRRFVLNKWDYSDVPNQLIKYEWYKQCCSEIYVPQITERRLGATDPAWEGDDSTVFAQMRGVEIPRLGWWEEYPKQDPDDSGTLAHTRAMEAGVKEGDWIVDPVGIGAATVLKMRKSHKFEPDMFIAGAEPDNTHGMMSMFNKRSEAHWVLREAMRLNEINIDHHPEFQRQCVQVKYAIDDKKFRIVPKKETKKELGCSPGHLDVAMMLAHKWVTTQSGLGLALLNRINKGQQEKNSATVSLRAAAERMAKIRSNRIHG